jgi:hypothetical protein
MTTPHPTALKDLAMLYRIKSLMKDINPCISSENTIMVPGSLLQFGFAIELIA